MGIYGTRDGIFTVKKLEIEDKKFVDYVIPVTATVATGAIAGAADFNAATAAKDNTDLTVQPPYPLNIGITTNTSPAGTAERIRVTGYDNLGNLRYEDVKIASTVGSTYYTNYSYAQITELQPYDNAGAIATTASDDLGVGYGNKAGLPYPLATSADLIAYVYGSTHATTAPTMTVAYNQVAVSGLAAAREGIHIMYMSKFDE